MPQSNALPRGPVFRATAAIAFAGGVVLVGVALLTTVSVLLRWLTSQPVRGDVELVSLGSGLAVLGFLAYGTAMRTNILVDTFTTWLPRRVAQAMDALWNLLWGAIALAIAERMVQGAAEALRNGTTTIGLLGVPIWWAIGIGAFCFATTGVAALAWTVLLARGRG